MFYVYNESNSGPFDPKMLGVLFNMDANRKFAEHFENYCYLTFILRHEATTLVEKQQANKEIVIAQKKMNYWKRMPNWDVNESGRLCDKSRKNWSLDIRY